MESWNNLPTAADYAQSSADDAKRGASKNAVNLNNVKKVLERWYENYVLEIGALNTRITELEQRIDELERR